MLLPTHCFWLHGGRKSVGKLLFFKIKISKKENKTSVYQELKTMTVLLTLGSYLPPHAEFAPAQHLCPPGLWRSPQSPRVSFGWTVTHRNKKKLERSSYKCSNTGHKEACTVKNCHWHWQPLKHHGYLKHSDKSQITINFFIKSPVCLCCKPRDHFPSSWISNKVCICSRSVCHPQTAVACSIKPHLLLPW